MKRDVDRPDEDADWNFRMRRETPLERLDRNWTDLLQELRVTQTGVVTRPCATPGWFSTACRNRKVPVS